MKTEMVLMQQHSRKTIQARSIRGWMQNQEVGFFISSYTFHKFPFCFNVIVQEARVLQTSQTALAFELDSGSYFTT